LKIKEMSQQQQQRKQRILLHAEEEGKINVVATTTLHRTATVHLPHDKSYDEE
jgi:hypothetical protein